MTITAEKINRVIQDINIMEDDLRQIRKELEMLRAEDAKPPDPEPLECWASFINRMPTHSQSYPFASGVHMREVTPQMLQNEKDAARYREHKNLAYFEPDHWGCNYLVAEWDERIDEAMGSK